MSKPTQLPLLPPAGVTNCELDVRAATSSAFLQNKKKVGNLIQARINTATGVFGYYVQNVPKDGTGCPGRWLVRSAWEHFCQFGRSIVAIRGEWIAGDNLDVVNRLTHGNQRTIEEAALQTWSAERAREFGFPRVTLLDSAGVPGRYQSVDVLFLP